MDSGATRCGAGEQETLTQGPLKWPAIGAREHPQIHSTFCFPAQNAGRTGTIVRDRLINSLYSSDYFYHIPVTGCHIPPLADPELIALIRATNENDVDNGLSSWIGRCCKRKRARAEAMPEEVGILFDRTFLPGKPQFKCFKAPVDSAPSAPPVDTRQPRSLSASASANPEIVVGSPNEAAPLHGPDLKQTCPRSGVAASPKPGDQSVDGDPAVGPGGSQITSFQPAVQHAGVRGSTGLMLPAFLPQSTLPPALSAGSLPPSFHNQPTSFSQYARPPHLRESSAVCFAC